MLAIESPNVTIHDVIARESLTTQYQPLVAIKKKSILAVEALTRGVCPFSGEIIPPNILFHLAAEAGVTLELDRLCRQRALAQFRTLHRHDEHLLLFINFDTSIIDQGVVGSNFLYNQVQQCGLSPHTIAIELIESRVHDLQALKRFVDMYRDYGFIIALDDVGSGHSNLDRIPLIKPDVLKIDRSLIRNIHTEYYKRVVFKSLVSMAKSLGALVVAEGIECEEDAVTALELGADLLQGFFFARPQDPNWEEMHTGGEQMISTASSYRASMIAHVNALKARHQSYDRLITRIIQELGAVNEAGFDNALIALVMRYQELECIYVLNRDGVQVSETICSADMLCRQANFIFRPAKRGADHSLKEYYYLLMNTSIEKYTTEPYISLASGNRCITISVPFRDADGEQRILCVDVNPE